MQIVPLVFFPYLLKKAILRSGFYHVDKDFTRTKSIASWFRVKSLRNLSSYDGNVRRQRTPENMPISFVLLRDYFNLFNFYRNGELSRNQISRSGVKKMKHSPSCVYVLHTEFGHFTLLFCRGRQRNVPNL